MSIPSSTWPAVKAYLLDAITTQVADTSVTILYSPPGPNQQMSNDVIGIGDVHRQIKVMGMVGSGGAGWLEETYTVEVVVSSFAAGDQQDTVDIRCALLEAAVITAVRNDPSLGGLVIVARPEQSVISCSWDEKGLGRFSVANVPITCSARI